MVGSGAELQSARKRTANEAIDRAPIDTAYQRFVADSQTGEGGSARTATARWPHSSSPTIAAARI
jgi:hypothetical protein